MTNEQQVLNDEYTRVVHHLNELWECIKENHWENEQWVLDQLDKLNELSIRN